MCLGAGLQPRHAISIAICSGSMVLVLLNAAVTVWKVPGKQFKHLLSVLVPETVL